MTQPNLNRLPNVFVVLMGPSGSGKSHLIDLLLGTTDPKRRIANHTVDAHTKKIKGYQYWNPPEGLRDSTYCITFIDTPGAREANNTDKEVSDMVAKWMEANYGQVYPIGAVLYLRRSQERKEPATPFLPKVFENMFRPTSATPPLGDKPICQLSLVMTHWDCAGDRTTVGKRKADLEGSNWAQLITSGARSDVKDDDSTAGAWRTVARALEPYLQQATTVNTANALTGPEREAHDKLSKAMENYQVCLSNGVDASVALQDLKVALDAVTGYRPSFIRLAKLAITSRFK